MEVLAALLGPLVAPVALAAGIVLQWQYPGDFGYTLEQGGPGVGDVGRRRRVASSRSSSGSATPARVRRQAALASALLLLPTYVHGLANWSPSSARPASPLTPGLVAALKANVPAGAIVASDPETSYRIAATVARLPLHGAAGARRRHDEEPALRAPRRVAPLRPHRRPRDPARTAARPGSSPMLAPFQAGCRCRLCIATGATRSTVGPVSEAALRTPSRTRGGVLLAIGIASSVFFLWLVFRNADLHQVWHVLKGADLGLVLLADDRDAGRVRRAGRPLAPIADVLELSVRRFYALVLAGIGANNVLPLRIGDLLRARWLATSADIPTGRALGSVFRDRACDVIALVVALVVSIPAVGGAALGRRESRSAASSCSRFSR